MKKENLIIFLLTLPSGLVFLILAFQWTLIDLLTSFLFPSVARVAWLVLASAVLISIILLFFKGRSKRLKFYLPLVACICTCLAAEFVPFTAIGLNFNFWFYKKEREQVAADIFSGKLHPNVAYNLSLIALPSNAEALSSGGGEAVIENFENAPGVYFFTYRGILGSSSGYLFMSSDVIPSGQDLVDVQKVAPRWFFVRTR